MKKLLSILLSVLMVVSCMTCMFTTASAVTGTSYGSYVVFDQAGENLIADFDATNLGSGSQNCFWRSFYTDRPKEEGATGTSNVIKYEAGALWQGFYVSLVDDNFNSLIQPGEEYKFSFYLKNPTNKIFSMGLKYSTDWEREYGNGTTTGDPNHFIGYGYKFNEGNPDSSVTQSLKDITLVDSGNASDNWVKYETTITAEDSTKAAGCHVDLWFNFAEQQVAPPEGQRETFLLSDLTLIKEGNVKMGAKVEGNGAAKAVPGANSITFTATPYQDAEFIGWYDGETELSKEITYVYNYDVVAEKFITAKFSGVNLVADKINTDWKSYNLDWRHVDNYNRNLGTSYLGGNSAGRGWCDYQMMYLPVDLAANTEYSFQTYLSNNDGSNIIAEAVKIFKDSDIPEGFTGNIAEGSEYNANNGYYQVAYNSSTTVTNWVAFPPTPATFTTADAGTYLIGIKFGNCTNAEGGSANKDNVTYINVSDWSLTPTTVVDPGETFSVAVNATGNGAAKASATTVNAYGTVTLTATSYLDSAFLGWYNGETEVSKEAVLNYTVTEDITLTAKFADENLLEGKNVANVQQTSETGTPDTGLKSAVTATEGWWSNGWPAGGYTATDESHLGGAAITNSSMGYQAHVYTMLLKPNTKYSLQFSLKSSSSVNSVALLNSSATFIYRGANGKDGGGKWIGDAASAVKKWIEGETTQTYDWRVFSHTFTTSDSDQEKIPYFIYFAYDDGQPNTTDFTGAYVSDLSLVEAKEQVAFKVNSKGKGAAKVSNATPSVGSVVTLTATPYEGAKFNGWYDGDTLISTEAVYNYTVTGSATLTAKFSGVNLASNVKVSDWYDFVGNNTTNCHVANNVVAGESHLGGNAFVFTNLGYGNRYFWLDLDANTEYSVNYFIKTLGASSSCKLDAKVTVYKKSEIENYSANKDAIVAAGGKFEDLWEFRPNLIPDYCTYRQERGGSYTVTNQYTNIGGTFTTADAGEYIIMVKFAGLSGQVSVSDLCVSPVREDAVKVEGNGTVKSSIEEVANGKKVTAVATAYQDSKFIGWYEGDTLLSTNLEYTAVFADAVNLTAKFSDVNLAAGLNMAARWQKGQYSWITIDGTEDSMYGGSAVSFTGTVLHQAAYLPITLKSGNEYSMSFAYKLTGIATHQVCIIGPDLEISSNQDHGGMITAGTELCSFISTPGMGAGSEIPEYTIFTGTFTTPVSSNDTETYYLYVKHNEEVTTQASERAGYISDLSIVDLTARFNVDFADFSGNSIRTTGSQALRYSYSIDEKLLTEGYMGYTVKEIGIVAIRTKYLNGAELKKDLSYVYKEIPRSVSIGLVYNENFNGFANIEGGRAYFNIALTNIGVNAKDGSVLYDAYGDDYTIRTYMIVTDGNVDYTYYDDAVDASVFAVMNTIISAYNSTATPSAQLESDYNNVMAIINSTQTDAKGRTVKECYEAKYTLN